MEQIKLGSGSSYDLVAGGIVDSGDEKLRIIVIPGEKTFSEIEAEFENEANTQRMEVLDSTGEPMDVKKGYTHLESIQKQKDYIIGREEIQGEAEEVSYRDIMGTVYILLLTKPDLRTQVNNIQETVDALVLSELGV